MIDQRRRKTMIVIFLLPTVLLYVGLLIYPTTQALRFSFYDWKGFSLANAKYIGLGNFQEAIGDKWVHVAITNNALIVFVGGAFMFLLAIFFAVVLAEKRTKGKRLFKLLIMLPLLINEVGIALFWTFVVNDRFGLLNGTLRALGLGAWTQVWLGEKEWARVVVIFVIVWTAIGFYMMLLHAGIKQIPSEIGDAARVDGANDIQRFFFVTLPLLRDVFATGIILWTIYALRSFGIIWAMTQGGPARSTHVLSTLMFENIATTYKSQASFRFGYAASLAVIQFAIVLIFSAAFFLLSRKERVEYS